MRYYKNLEFKQNSKSNKIIKSEIPYFYNYSDFTIGNFYRVQLPKIKLGEEFNPIRYLNTFLFLNPKLDENLCCDFYRYSYKSLKDFTLKPDEFRSLLIYKSKITYKNCYTVNSKIIYNEVHITKEHKLDLYSKSFRKELNEILNTEKNEWVIDANVELLKISFFDLINNVSLSYEKLALDNRIKIDEVEKYLSISGIYIRDEELEFLEKENKYDEKGKVIGVSKSTKKIIKRQSYKDYVIEKQIKYLLNKPNEIFNLDDIVNGCKYYSEYYDIIIHIDKGYIKNWVNNNKFYKRFIKYHMKEFSRKKKIIIRQNKIMIIFLHINKESKDGNRVEYKRTQNGKLIPVDFGEEAGENYSKGNKNKIYAHKYDIDEELGTDEEFEL